MLSSLTIALLTDSAIVIRWRHISKYIEEPFKSTFANFSGQASDLNADYSQNTIMRIRSRQKWSKITLPQNAFDSLIRTYLPADQNRFLISFQSWEPYFFELAANPIYYEKYATVK